MSSSAKNNRTIDELARRVSSGWTLLNRTCPADNCLTTLVRNRAGRSYCVSCQLWCIDEADLTAEGKVPTSFTKHLDLDQQQITTAPSHTTTTMDDIEDYSIINGKEESPQSSRLSGVSDKLGAKMLAGWTMLGIHCPGDECTCPIMRDRTGIMLCVQCDRNVIQVGDDYRVVTRPGSSPPTASASPSITITPAPLLTSPIRMNNSHPSPFAVPPSPAGAGRAAPPSTPIHGALAAPIRPRVSFSSALSRLTGHAEEEEDQEDRALREREKELERDPDSEDEDPVRASRPRSDSELEREIAEFEAQEPDHAALAAIEARMQRVNKTSSLLGQKMLTGYTLLGVHCPDCHCPLVRKKDGPMECVSCEATVIRESDAATASATTPATSITISTSTAATSIPTLLPAKRPSEVGIKEEPSEKKLRPRVRIPLSRDTSMDDISAQSQLLATPQSRAGAGVGAGGVPRVPTVQKDVSSSATATPPTTPMPATLSSAFSYSRPSFSLSSAPASPNMGPTPFTPVMGATSASAPTTSITFSNIPFSSPSSATVGGAAISPTAAVSLPDVISSTISLLTIKLAHARDLLSTATTIQQMRDTTALIRDLCETLKVARQLE